MREARDPLEAELAALRPQQVSPGLRRRVAERLADAPSPRLRRRRWLALAVGSAAACLAVLFSWGGGRRIEPERLVVRPPPALPVVVEDPGPSHQAYWRALMQSPEELDALLDKHAVGASALNPELARLSAFPRSYEALHTILGEP